MRETVGIAIATVIKLRFLFRTFQNGGTGTRIRVGQRRNRIVGSEQAIENRKCPN